MDLTGLGQHKLMYPCPTLGAI